MKSLQFNPKDGIADQFKSCVQVSTMSTTENILRKYLIASLDTYVFYYNDIHDAFLLVYFKFYLDLEPVFAIFGKILIFCTI
jgi:hypothetical protein